MGIAVYLDILIIISHDCALFNLFKAHSVIS